jgi:serine protease
MLGVGCFDSNTASAIGPGTVIDFKDDASPSEIIELGHSLGLDLSPNSKVFSSRKITITNQNISESVKRRLLDSDLVESVEPNFTIALEPANHPGFNEDEVGNTHTYTHTNLPNDPLYLDGKQWNFDFVGMPAVWESKAKLGDGVIVAVIDTGVSDGNHSARRVPDLAQTCIKEGYNFVDDNTDAYDAHGHGTHVAGTIAQSTNNGIGVAGLAPNACILPIKVLSDQGSGTVADIADGIYLATEAGAKVINLSLGSSMPSEVIAKAVKHAADQGVFLSCAAGNDSKNVVNYPAGHPGCHAISAVNKSGELAWYSSHGKSTEGQMVFLAAPGGDIREDINGGIWQDTVDPEDITKHGYFPFQGTSMAAPHVAGVAALIISNLEDPTLSSVEDILASTATNKDDEEKFGHGLVNASAAVQRAVDSNNNKAVVVGSLAVGLLALLGVILSKNKK